MTVSPDRAPDRAPAMRYKEVTPKTEASYSTVQFPSQQAVSREGNKMSMVYEVLQHIASLSIVYPMESIH